MSYQSDRVTALVNQALADFGLSVVANLQPPEGIAVFAVSNARVRGKAVTFKLVLTEVVEG